MKNFKIILLSTVMFWLVCGIDFYSCDEVDDDLPKVQIKTPTNDYQVAVMIYSAGGVRGCTAASVEKAGIAIGDAEIIINKELIAESDTIGMAGESIIYFDTVGVVSYLPKTEYELEVRHNEQTIATGNIIMPSSPTITNLTFPYTHQLNQSLTIEWKKVQDATAIEFILFGEAIEQDIDTILSPQKTSFTIPGTFFSEPDELTLEISAINGANLDVISGKYQDEDGNYTRSINLNGAAGIFCAMNFESDEEFIITVIGEESLGKHRNITPHKKDFKEILKNKHWQKLNPF